MKASIAAIIVLFILSGCSHSSQQTNKTAAESPAIIGTWQLVTGIIIEKNDSTITDYTKKQSFIKIINNTHFAFLMHDTNSNKDSLTVFAAGGGRYSLSGNTYTEHLEYCSDRNWEGHDFSFTVTIRNDTLTQTGIEKIEASGIDRLNTEIYVRVAK